MRRLAVPIVGNLIMMVLGLAATKVMALSYRPADFGLVAYVNGLTIMFAVFADLGLGVVHMKRLGDGANVRDCVRVYLTVKLLLLVFVALPMVAFIARYVPFTTRLPFEDVAPVIGIMALTWFLAFLSQSIGHTFAGLHDMTRQFGIEVARSATLLVFLLVTAGRGGAAVHLATGYLVASLVSMLVAVVLIWPHRGGRFDRTLWNEYRALAIPLAVGVILVTVSRNCDGLLVAAVTSLHDAGVYYAAKRVVSPLDSIGGYLGYMVVPFVASLNAATGRSAIAGYLAKLEHVLAVLFAPALAFAIVFAAPIAQALLGPAYAGAAPVLALMGAGYIVAAIGVPYSSLFAAIGRPKIATWIAALSTVAWLLGSLVMAPRAAGPVGLMGWGAVGMAIAFFGAALLRTLLERRAAARLVKSRTHASTFAAVVIGFLASFIVAAVAAAAGWRPATVMQVGLTFVLVLALHTVMLTMTGLMPIGRFREWLASYLRTAREDQPDQPRPLSYDDANREVPTPFTE